MKPRKKRRIRLPRRLRRLLASLEILAFIVVFVPLLLIAAPIVLPLIALSERLRRCPLCGLRGTLQRAARVWPAEREDDSGLWLRRRVNPDLAQLRCTACGLNIRENAL